MLSARGDGGARDVETVPVAVFGAAGRMGRLVCTAVQEAADLELVAALGRHDPRPAADAAQVVVDFTAPDGALANAEWAVAAGKHAVVGTTGLDAAGVDRLHRLASAAGVGVLLVPNFSISALLARRFAVSAARYFESVEVVELAHDRKAEAPSGTAMEVAHALAAARAGDGRTAVADATTLLIDGARGAMVDSVAVHSVRLPGLVNHQEVLLGREGDLLSIRFDTIDRAAYLPGVLRAVRVVRTLRGLHRGLESVYDV